MVKVKNKFQLSSIFEWLFVILLPLFIIIGLVYMYDIQSSKYTLNNITFLNRDLGNLTKQETKTYIDKVINQEMTKSRNINSLETNFREIGFYFDSDEVFDDIWNIDKGRDIKYRIYTRLKYTYKTYHYSPNIYLDEDVFLNKVKKDNDFLYYDKRELLSMVINSINTQNNFVSLPITKDKKYYSMDFEKTDGNSFISTRKHFENIDVVDLSSVEEIIANYNPDIGSGKNILNMKAYLKDGIDIRLLDVNTSTWWSGKELDINKIKGYIEKSIAKKIDIEPKTAKIYKTDAGKINIDGFARHGRKVVVDDLANLLYYQAMKDTGGIVNIPFETIKTKIEGIEELGLVNLLATGVSDYSESSTARIKNIKRGFEVTNLILLKPNEEFSYNSHLPEVNSVNGFYPELVFAGDGIDTQYGGGLCQTSTTHYRAALNAGLDITMRRNHRYMVNHYEPAGTDATIYIPSPDLKWKNNTNNYLLIQTSLEPENELALVNIYGTDDGRSVYFDGPYKSNFTSAGDVYIKDPRLAKGQKILNVRGSPGFRVRWNYKILSKTGGIILDKEINSFYQSLANQWSVGG